MFLYLGLSCKAAIPTHTEPNNEMTTMTSDQFAWRQFSMTFATRETRETNTVHDERLDTERFDNFDCNVETSTTAKKRVQWSPKQTSINLKRSNSNHSVDTAATPATTTTASETDFKQIKKAKTRAERRVEEPEIVESDVKEPVARKERRTEYWVRRDDLRRNSARTMKEQFQ